MEPASATVAFVGFAASLVTLASIVANGSKSAASLYKSLKEAPDDVKRLLDNARNFEHLFVEIERKSREYSDAGRLLPAHLQQFWDDRITQMEIDFARLRDLLEGLERSLAGQSLSRTPLRARIKKYFSENTISTYEKILSDHRETLTLFFSILSE